MKNKINFLRERQKGFIKLIIFIIVALLLMKYFDVTISGAIDWFVSFFHSVFR